MPITRPGDPPPDPKFRWVLPAFLTLVFLGIAAPFAVARYHNSVIEAHQNETINALLEYASLQKDFFAKHNRYAEKFEELGGVWAAVKDVTAKTPTEFQGYRFKLFSSQAKDSNGEAKNFVDAKGLQTGGYALMAVPIKYGFTGRLTFFISSSSDKLYYHDLGVKTDTAVRMIAEYYLPPGTKAFN